MAVIIGPDSNRFFVGQATLQVEDDTTAFADDVNSLTQKTNTAFDLVEGEMDSLGGATGLSRKWATDPQGTRPEPTIDEYSSKAHAIEGGAWASADPGAGIPLADGTVSPEESAKTLALEAISSKDAAALSEIAAALSETAAGLSETAADASETAAASSETAAGLSEIAAADSETMAEKWSQNPEDVPVKTTPDEFSAYHWSKKAESIAGGDFVEYTTVTGSAMIPKGTTAQRDAAALSGFFRFNTETILFEGFNGIEWGPLGGGGGGGLAWETSDAGLIIGIDGAGYLLDCSAGPRIIDLPHGIIGEQIGVGDWKGNCSGNNITIKQDPANKIMGLAENLILDIDNSCIVLTYANSTEGWKIIQTTPSGNVLPNILHGNGEPSDSLGSDGDIYMKIA